MLGLNLFMTTHFSPTNPCKESPRGGGAEGSLVTILPKKKFYIDSGVFKSGDFKGAQGGAWGGGQRRYTTKNQVLCQFWGFNSGEFKNDLYFHLRVV